MNAILLLGAAFLGVLWTLDVVAKDAETARIAPVSGRLAAPLHAGRTREMVVVIDSLPHRVAVDPNVMPYLAAMRARSTFAETRTTRDAITVSALRAAFTGRERLSPFGVVENMRHEDEQVESIFSQAAAAGISIGITSDGSFDQFGTSVGRFHDTSGGDEPEADRQDTMAREGLADFVAGEHDFEVVHLTYGDHVAHRHGVHSPEYTETFQRLDRFVAEADRRVSEDDTLVVMGDHGHDEQGRHGPGIDEPTFALYRGKGFARGLDLREIPITEHRYLTSFALGLPLPRDYAGGRHPRALVPVSSLPADFEAAPEHRSTSPSRPNPASSLPLHARETWYLAALAAHVGMLAWIWLLSVRRDLAGSKSALLSGLAMWAVLLPLWLPSLRPFNSLLGLGLGAAWLLVFGRANPVFAPYEEALREVPSGVGAAVLAVVLAAWGFGLAALRARLDHLAIPDLDGLRVGAAATGAIAALRWGPMAAGWALLGASALLLYPDVGPYGSVIMLAPVWMCWLLFVLQADLVSRSGLRRVVVPGAVAIALLLPFLESTAEHGRFVGFDGPLAPRSTFGWLALATVAKAVIFLLPARRRTGLAGGVAMLVFLSAAEADLLPLHGRTGALTLVALFTATCTLHVFRERSPALGELCRTVRLGLLFAALLHLVRVPVESRAWADCLFAALVLSGVCARRSSDPEVVRRAPLFLLAIGVVASGFATLAWTTHRLEWAFLYDWFPGDLVEHRAPLFVPLLVGRYVLPVLIVRHLLRDVLDSPAPARKALGLGGLKVFALAVLVVGIGCHGAVSDAYVSVVQQEIIFFILVLGLLPWPRREQALSGAQLSAHRLSA